MCSRTVGPRKARDEQAFLGSRSPAAAGRCSKFPAMPRGPKERVLFPAIPLIGHTKSPGWGG